MERIFAQSNTSQIASIALGEVCSENFALVESILRAGAPCPLATLDTLIFRRDFPKFGHIIDLIDFSRWRLADQTPKFSLSMLRLLIQNCSDTAEPQIIRLLDGIQQNLPPSLVRDLLSEGSRQQRTALHMLSQKSPMTSSWRNIATKLVELHAACDLPIEKSLLQRIMEK